MTRIAILSALLFSACGGGADVEAACEAYLDTAKSCLDDVYVDDQTLLDTTWTSMSDSCAPYAGTKEQRVADYFDCLEAAYADADCGSAETYATTLAVTGCAL
ncbi:MAG: hypothetical protein ACI9MC_000646 [Kiritimatiellia bacterium]|jgi:hypothetical protein